MLGSVVSAGPPMARYAPAHSLVPRRLSATPLALVLLATATMSASACTSSEPNLPNLPYVVSSGGASSSGGRQSGGKTDDSGTQRDTGTDAGDSGAVCTFINSSRTADLTGCSIQEDYSCNKLALTIFCDCKTTFTCTCGNVTTLADCSNDCSGTTANIRAQCGVDTTPPIRDASPNDAAFGGD